MGITVEAWGIIGIISGIIFGLLTLGATIYYKEKHLELVRKKMESG
jgi:hypothetical protein